MCSKKRGILVSHYFQGLSNAQAHPVVTLAAISILKYAVTVQLGSFMFEIHNASHSIVVSTLMKKD